MDELSTIKVDLRGLIISCPTGMTIKKLERDYIETVGKSIPFTKLGFNKLEHFLKSLTDTLTISGTGPFASIFPVVTQENEHISRMVQSQRVPKRSNQQRRTVMPHRNNNYHSQYRKPSYNTYYQPPHRFPPQHIYTPPPLRNDLRWRQSPQQRCPQPIFITPQQFQFQMLQQPQQQNHFFNGPQNSIPRTHNWGPHTNPQGPIEPLISIPFRKQYFEQPTVVVPVKQIIPEVESIPQEEPVKQIVPEAEEPKPKIVSDNEDENSDSFENEIANLSMEAVRSNDSSTSNFENDVQIFETSERPGPKESALPKFDLNDPIYLSVNNKSDLLNVGDTIKNSLIPVELADGNSFGLFISEVNSPAKFWFHLKSESNVVDDLMYDLELFYGSLRECEFDIKITNCRVGLICAALFSGHWHRAKMLEIFKETGEVKIFYIDYGTVMKVAINQTKFLRKEFADVPSMVYRGCLSKILPIKTRYSVAATNCFFSKVNDRPLVGLASYIDFDEQIVYMVLNDTSTDEDFCINNHLFEKGYAKLTEVEDLINNKTSNYYTGVVRKKHFGELYPTFEMLENGEFPNIVEMEKFLLEGVNCFEAFDENPELIKKMLQHELEKTLTISDKCTIDDSIDDPVETNPFKILNQTNPFFTKAAEEFNADCEVAGNLNSTMDKFHNYSARLNFKQQLFSNSSNESDISDDSLDTID